MKKAAYWVLLIVCSACFLKNPRPLPRGGTVSPTSIINRKDTLQTCNLMEAFSQWRIIFLGSTSLYQADKKNPTRTSQDPDKYWMCGVCLLSQNRRISGVDWPANSATSVGLRSQWNHKVYCCWGMTPETDLCFPCACPYMRTCTYMCAHTWTHTAFTQYMFWFCSLRSVQESVPVCYVPDDHDAADR